MNVITADQILGLGCMGAWIVLLKYLMKLQSYKTILSSLKNGAAFVFYAFISICPVFIGYAFLGMALFWRSRRFANFSVSCYTLLAMIHADMMWDTYMDMMQVNSVQAQIYLFTFIFISIAVIGNIFTIIIEEGFMQQKFDDDYTYLIEHTSKHMGLGGDSKGSKEQTSNPFSKENASIYVDSQVIISEYRLLQLKYKQQINLYKKAIADMSLRQIVNFEEEEWIKNKKLEEHTRD